MKSVTFLINSIDAGGAERVLSLLASQLNKEHIHIRIICLEKEVFYSIPQQVELIFLKKNKIKSNQLAKIFELFIFACQLRYIIKKEHIKLVQSHLFRANYVNLIAKFLGAGHKTQIVNTVAVSTKYKKNNFNGFINLILIKYLYPFADLIVHKSKAMHYDFKKLFHIRTKQIVINNPCDISKIKILSKKTIDGKLLGISKNTLIAVGRLESHKNYEFLLHVFSNIKKRYSSLDLCILGEGTERNKLELLMKKLDLGDSVVLAGSVENPYPYLFKAKIYISCSESEGFPNAMVEAMACGIPVISSDCLSGPREILAPNKYPQKRLNEGYECALYGILFAVNDDKALENAIELLVTDSSTYKRYQYRVKKRAENFAIKKILPFYKEILNI